MCGVGASESHALPRQAIEMGRRMLLAAVAVKVTDAHIVGKDQDDVGLGGLGRSFLGIRGGVKSETNQQRDEARKSHLRFGGEERWVGRGTAHFTCNAMPMGFSIVWRTNRG